VKVYDIPSREVDGDIHVPISPVFIVDITDRPGLCVAGGAAVKNMVSGVYEEQRTPSVFKHALITAAGSTALWTPTAGKKFRILGYVICPDAGLAAAGVELITFLDNATAITIAHQTYLPIAASIAHQVPMVIALPGNGYLSVAADNVLNVSLGTAVTAGAISVFVYGTEE
jgi:hypothetical protein